MDRVREVASAGLALRKAKNLRVRLPLARLTVVTDDPGGLAGFGAILSEELNVKQVEVVEFDESSLDAYGIARKLTVNSRAAGPRIGKQVQTVIQAAKAGEWQTAITADGTETVVVGGVELVPGEFDLELHAADESIALAFLGSGGFVLLDTTLTPELEAEGLARDVIRAIQDTRKAADLKVSDRIRLEIRGSSSTDVDALASFGETIVSETLALASSFEWADDPATQAALGAKAGSQRTTLGAGQYSNAGVLVIDVWKSEQVDV
jgi:isoleucyl-tRNA synthetase